MKKLVMFACLLVVACSFPEDSWYTQQTQTRLVPIHDCNPVVIPEEAAEVRIVRAYPIPYFADFCLGKVQLGINNWHWCPSDLVVLTYYRGRRGCFVYAREMEEGFYESFDCWAFCGMEPGDTLFVVFIDAWPDCDGGTVSDIDGFVELVPKGSIEPCIHDDGGLNEEDYIKTLYNDEFGVDKRPKR